MLLYSCLYLTGYDLTLDDLKQFRQWGSRTPGHPEYRHTAGVETTTGPLGQGVGNSVGMAVAEAHLATIFNRPDHEIVDHYTYFICSDGDMMEGVSHEAASFAGHFGLGCVFRLIPITCFARRRSPVSVQADQAFRSMSISYFARRRSRISFAIAF